VPPEFLRVQPQAPLLLSETQPQDRDRHLRALSTFRQAAMPEKTQLLDRAKQVWYNILDI
jgi:hypothetical protein